MIYSPHPIATFHRARADGTCVDLQYQEEITRSHVIGSPALEPKMPPGRGPP